MLNSLLHIPKTQGNFNCAGSLNNMNLKFTKINLEKATIHISENEIDEVVEKLDAFAYHLPNQDGWFIVKGRENIPASAKNISYLGKRMKTLDQFLTRIDKLPEAEIKHIMGSEYIDTPGFYQKEKKDYSDIQQFMLHNMSTSNFESLEQWYWDNPDKVKMFWKIDKSYKYMREHFNKRSIPA